MTRLHPAAWTRALRALIGIGAALILAMVASGCVSSTPSTSPTPDPFAGLADRSDQAFRQGLEAYGQGQYRDALTSFEQSRTLSPSADPRISQMIDRTRAAMAPTPTPVPVAPTEVPAAPTATPAAMSTLTPDTDLSRRYFGQVTLAVVPGRDSDAPAATQFFFQDQIGLHIDGLKQHLRLPFTLRVFNTDTARLVAEVQSDDNAAAALPSAPVGGLAMTAAQAAAYGVAPAALSPTITPTAPTAAQGFKVARFWDTYVWYHQGGEEPGHYRAELYASGVLTNVFEYGVGSVPVAAPEPTLAPVVEPTPSLPTVQEAAAVPPPPVPAPAPPVSVRAPSTTSQAAPVATAQPTALPSPTPVPTPAQAYTTAVGGVPAGLDVNPNTGRFYLADSSGVIWTTDAATGQQRPSLGKPFNIGNRVPVDLAADPSTNRVFLSTRVCAPAAPGCILAVDGESGTMLASISLPAAPGDLRLDPDYGLLYVALPERQAIAEVNIRAGNVVRLIDQLPQITSLALDPARHTLYAAHLAGQLTVIDVPSGQVTSRMSLTGAGLASVATSRGLAYAVNTATHELAVAEPVSQSVSRYALSQEPAAVAAAEDTGAVYVLSSRSDVILQIDPSDGSELGRVLLASRSGHASVNTSNVQSLRPRMVLNANDDTLYASLPEAGTLAAVANDQFPVMARSIPFAEIPDQSVASTIPGVIQPAADPLPAQAAPSLQAQAPDVQSTTPDTDEEGL